MLGYRVILSIIRKQRCDAGKLKKNADANEIAVHWACCWRSLATHNTCTEQLAPAASLIAFERCTYTFRLTLIIHVSSAVQRDYVVHA